MDRNVQAFQDIYPAYLVVTGDNTLVTVCDEGAEWFVLFGTKDLAERYVEESGQDLAIRVAENANSLGHIISPHPDIAGFLWSSRAASEWRQFIRRDDFV